MAPAVIAAIISGISSLASSGMAAKKSKDKNNEGIETLASSNKYGNKWFNVRRSVDQTKLADKQAQYTKEREILGEGLRNADGTLKTIGGSDYAYAAQKESVNKAVSELERDDAARGEEYKRQLDMEQLKMNQAYAQQKSGIEMNQANASALAGAQASSAAVQMGGALMDYYAKNEADKVQKSESTQPDAYQQMIIDAAAAADDQKKIYNG